jgi:hypothetical protein
MQNPMMRQMVSVSLESSCIDIEASNTADIAQLLPRPSDSKVAAA